MYKNIVITLSVVSIDYKCLHILIQVWFGGSIAVSGPQGAGSAPSLQCILFVSALVLCNALAMT